MAVILDKEHEVNLDSGFKVDAEVVDGKLQLKIIGKTKIISDTSIIPPMTSNTTPAPFVASASSIISVAYDAWKAFNGKNLSNEDRWTSYQLGVPQWLKIDLGQQKIIKGYGITSINANSPQNPRSWILEGSNDDINWEVIHSVSDEPNWQAGERRKYLVDNTEPFRFYRITITQNFGTTVCTIGELELFEEIEVPIFSEQGICEYGPIDLSKYVKEINSIVIDKVIFQGTNIKIYTATSNDYVNYSEWSPVDENGNVTSPIGRYLKIKIELIGDIIIDQKTIYSFNESDKDKFEENEFVEFNNGLRLKTQYTQPFNYVGQLDDGTLLETTIDRTKFKSIDALNTTSLPNVVVEFNYTGSEQTWIVPRGITSILVEAWGASGGSGSSPSSTSTGGKGGYAKGRIPVTPQETLYVYVGESGDGLSRATFNGGGSGARAGGGATDLRQGGNELSNRVIVAGGGGAGAHGIERKGNGGYGGGANSNGGWSYGGSSSASSGGTLTSGGKGSNGGGDGSFGYGGNGIGAGGGGGGGYYGGGGGGTSGNSGSGGGGGSGYVTPLATEVYGENDVRQGHGLLKITYSPFIRFLIEDNGNLKTYDGNSIIEIGNLPLSFDTFNNYGIESLSIIDYNFWNQIGNSTIKILAYISELSFINLDLIITCTPFSQVIVPKENIFVMGKLININSIVNKDELTDIRYVVSRDDGITWMTYKSGLWLQMDLRNKSQFVTMGMLTDELNNITPDIWRNFSPQYNLKFAFYIDIPHSSLTAEIKSFECISTYSFYTPRINSLKINYKMLDPIYSGLMFMDTSQQYYSTSFGEILKYLDFGTLIQGQTSLDVKVYLTNTLPFAVKNIRIYPEHNIDGLTVELSKTNLPFIAESELFYDQVLGFDEVIEFYVRLTTDKNKVGGGTFDIKVKADAV